MSTWYKYQVNRRKDSRLPPGKLVPCHKVEGPPSLVEEALEGLLGFEPLPLLSQHRVHKLETPGVAVALDLDREVR